MNQVESTREAGSPEMILEKLSELRLRVKEAAGRRDRDASQIEIVAVVKHASTEDVRALLRSKEVRYFGESRIQDAKKRRLELGTDAANVQWRFIGHLQSNKARAAAELFDTIDSVDSLKVAEALDAQIEEGGRKKVLVQVKLSARETQSGVLPQDLAEFLSALGACRKLAPCGMLAILPMVEPVEAVRPYCKEFKTLFDRHFPEGGAGMSRDFEIAVEEGANLLRIGTALFGN